jgi:DNA-binding response OmpR family regulator
LIVDDSQLVLEVLRDFFVNHGYLVDQAESAEVALALLENAVPDIIVSDVLMPGMDGWGLFETVRDRAETSQIPFVFLTSQTELPQRLRGIETGAEDYVTKPFDVEELHARIERILERAAESKRPAMGHDDSLLSGSFEHLGMSDLLQVLSLNDTDGEIVLHYGEYSGRVVLAGGDVVHAECGTLVAIKALYRMLDWSTASFRLVPPQVPAAARTIDVPTANLVMNGLVSLDEWRRWSEELPALDKVVAQTARARLELDELDAAGIEVVNLAADGTSLREILDRNPRRDSQLAEALVECLRRGVLRTVE